MKSQRTPVNISDVAFGPDGLVPAIIQEATTGRVLMLGYMNATSLEQTLSGGRVVFWSRSRGELWRKGDTSGNIQVVQSVSLDCDGDAILVTVNQTGPACHTGDDSCFDRGAFSLPPATEGAGS